MTSSSKKRKDASQNGSLLDFFSAPAAAKKGRMETAAANAGSYRSAITPCEVIVIDSDTEDNGVGDRESRSETTTRDKCDARQSPKNEKKVNHETPITFGKPCALLLADNHVTETHASRSATPSGHQPAVETSKSIFGSASSLLQATPCLPLAFPSEAPSHDRSPLPTPGGDDMVVQCPTSTSSLLNAECLTRSPLLETEEWDTGDDELAPSTESEDVDRQSENTSDVTQLSGVCPVCNKELLGISSFVRAVRHLGNAGNAELYMQDMQHHANECLDLATLSNGTDQTGYPLCASTQLLSPVSNRSIDQRAGHNLYSVLMASSKEDEVWNETDAASSSKLRRQQGSRRKAPFYKVLQGMHILITIRTYHLAGKVVQFIAPVRNPVDLFVSILTYKQGDTANLIIHMLSVDRKWIHPLPMGTPTLVPDTGGVTVTLIEANHCPGSCLFLFEGLQTVDAGDSAFKSPHVGSARVFRYLHCGDFRASPRHVLHPAVRGKHIDHIYLDTTYLDPKTHATAYILHRTYTIGKERIVKAIAQILQTKIYCDERKAAVLRCQNDQELHELLTSDPLKGGVHLLPLGLVASDKLKSYVQRFGATFSRVIGFRPTGWTYTQPTGSNHSLTIQAIISQCQSRAFSFTDLRPTQKSTYEVQLFGVPYSEHSSFFELTCFAMSCDWGKIIPTVNVANERTRLKMAQWIERWGAGRKGGGISFIQPREEDYW
ncbi:hypothetical protein ID866_3821 [Astraeus odoratus]|nr:hypothetical protein ID866_3821 [Astraeus odoratus]